ncbi:MAG: glycerol-3-phosphate dehydrogenase, partial [Pseudomonadota bacterium]
LDAKERGATVLTRTACVNLDPAPDKDAWEVTLEDTLNGDQFQVKCKCIVNAAGPWVRSLLDTSELSKDYENKKSTAQSVRLVKGSHIIVPQIYEGDHSYILQQDDNRIVFAIPYEKKFTLIGTTDKAFDGDPSMVEIDDDEKQYLCGSVNRFFQKQITPNDIVSSYSGVRPLVDDGEENASKVTRDYKIHLDKRFGPAIFSVFGGKITTFRKLSEEVVDRVTTLYPNKAMPSWTETVPLPGGDIPDANFDKFVESQQSQYSFAPKDLIYRYARAYGTRMDIILGSAQSLEELGTHYGDDIYESELLYLIHNEFALTVDDILWRRSKLLLHISAQTISKIESALPVLVRALKEEERQYA